jgi:hypothetical protein
MKEKVSRKKDTQCCAVVFLYRAKRLIAQYAHTFTMNIWSTFLPDGLICRLYGSWRRVEYYRMCYLQTKAREPASSVELVWSTERSHLRECSGAARTDSQPPTPPQMSDMSSPPTSQES